MKDQNTEDGKIAVVYARFSSHNQTEQSIEGQLAAAQTYAAAKGYMIIHEYIDRAMTGRNDNRDEFQQMLSDCAKKQFQIIIVWKVDRFGRNREEITFNKYRAKKHGVRVEYVAENLPDSPEGVILESVLEGMAEYYSLQLSQNVKRGLRESAKKGKVFGGKVPLGYTISKDKTYQLDPKTAPTVKMIFDLYVSGKTCAEIARHLNSLGLRTSTGGEFNKNSLRPILKNEKYVGVYESKTMDVRIDDGIPAIVDRNTFDTAQLLLRENQKAPSRSWDKSDYLLTDKLFCGHCGSAMIGESGRSHTGTKYNYYLCGSHKRKTGCPKRAVRQDWIEDYVIKKTVDLLFDDDLLNWIVDNTWTFYQAESHDESKRNAIQKQLDDVNRANANILRAIEAGIFNDTTRVRMEELQAQKTALEAALASYELDSAPRLTKDYIAFFLYDLRNLNLEDRDCQKRLIDVFVNSIYVYDDHLIINYNFSGDKRTVRYDEMQAAEPFDGFGCRAEIPALLRAAEPYTVRWFANVISVKIALPDR